ncbi:MAG: DUF72 domain-containing protein, partial [Bacteroidota bacterium]
MLQIRVWLFVLQYGQNICSPPVHVPDRPQKQWFQYYARHFNTIEINSSFYRQPSPKSFLTWYNDSPDDF